MTFLVQHIRSGEFARRPQPLDLSPGQLAVNYNADSTGLFFRTDNGELVKVGPTHVGSAAPSQINWTERSIGEMWLDTTDPQNAQMKVWTIAGWTLVKFGAGNIDTASIANGAVTAEKLTINNTLIPAANDQFDFGSSVNRFSVIYTDEINSNKLASTITPSNNTVTIGTTGDRFSAIYATDVYTGDLHLKNEKGDWTVIEDEDFLTLRNNKTGKKFKIVMEAID